MWNVVSTLFSLGTGEVPAEGYLPAEDIFDIEENCYINRPAASEPILRLPAVFFYASKSRTGSSYFCTSSRKRLLFPGSHSSKLLWLFLYGLSQFSQEFRDYFFRQDTRLFPDPGAGSCA